MMEMDIPDGFIVKALASAIRKPGADARAVKLARLFSEQHPELVTQAITFAEAITATLAEG